MDPEECLRLLEHAASNWRTSQAMEHLENYINWRRMGGFQPLHGDLRAAAAVADLLPSRVSKPQPDLKQPEIT